MKIRQAKKIYMNLLLDKGLKYSNRQKQIACAMAMKHLLIKFPREILRERKWQDNVWK